MKKERAGDSGPVVVVQWIEVEWGKDASGAEAATQRNRLPAALPLPELVLRPETNVVLHKSRFTERDDFAVPTVSLKEYVQLSSLHLPSVHLSLSGQQLLMNPVGLWNHILRPPQAVPVGLAALETGEWCRVRQSRRVVYESTWRYLLTTLNIAYGLPPTAPVFLGRPPLLERADVPLLY